MPFVYAIQNLRNLKIYVGVTSGTIEYRWKKHLNAAKNGKKNKLYDSIRKNGEESFCWFKLAEFESLADAYEREEILIRLLDSRENGYNIAHGGTDGVRKEIVISGELFDSHAAAAKAYNVPYAKFMDLLLKGRSPEEAAGIVKYKKFQGEVYVNGVTYRTLNFAASQLGLDPINVRKRVKNLGWTIEQALGFADPPTRKGQYKRVK